MSIEPPAASIYDQAFSQIEQLCRERDRFFLDNPSNTEHDRKALMTRKIADLQHSIEQLAEHADFASGKSRHRFLYLLGKAHNLTRSYDAKCDESLTKAVKLEPLCADAWNELAECLAKKPDLEAAKNCLVTCLKWCKNPRAVVNLSMLTR